MAEIDDQIAAAAAAYDALKAANDKLTADNAAQAARIAELEGEVPNPDSLATLARLAGLATQAPIPTPAP